MDRTTRHDLKSDQFVEQVGHIVESVEEHRSEVVRYAVIGLVVVLLAGAGFWYWQSRKAERAEALGKVIRTWTGRVGVTGSEFSFQTPEARDKALVTAANTLISKHSGSDEAGAAEFILATMYSDQGKSAEADRYYQAAAKDGGKEYGTLAKLAIADRAAADKKVAEAEKLYKELLADPTELVSKDQVTIQLARLYAANNRDAEAQKLLEPLRVQNTSVGRAAIRLSGEIASAKLSR